MSQGDDDDYDDTDDEREDYMQMQVHDEPAQSLTYSQQRLKRVIAGEEKGRVRPPAEVEREKRRTALETPLEGGLGQKLMQKMGYAGGGLGRHGKTVEPVVVEIKENRGGVGHDTLIKRKLADAAEEAQKRQKDSHEGYIDHRRTTLDARKTERQLRQAQAALESLEVKEHHLDASTMPSQKANVLWRGRLVEKRQAELRRLEQKQKLDAIVPRSIDDESDDELEQFLVLDQIEQLERVLTYLRQVYFYCLYCGMKYDDADDLADCPGLLEEDHD